MLRAKKLNALSIAFHSLLYLRHIILNMLISVLLIIFISQPCLCITTSQNLKEHSTHFQKQNLNPALPQDSEPIDECNQSLDDDVLKDEIDTDIANETGAHEHIVYKGEVFSGILTQYDIDREDIKRLIKIDKEIHHLQVGQKFLWILNNYNQIQRLTWKRSQNEIRYYDRIKEGFQLSISFKTGEWHRKITRIIVNGSFINSAKVSGLNHHEIGEVIKSLQWQIDFRKLHDGDRFEILTMYETVNGVKQQSEVLGVKVHNISKDYYAIRASDGKFYNRSGTGLASGFMRFPTVKKYRISSRFNPRRTHPVTGQIAPHKGVDFAVPVGTPVLSIGNGQVILSKYSETAGNYVAIRHGRQYMTRYMHLQTLLVKKGQKVKRGEYIALSGNTGRSTGPHIHFEIWINNQAVNPLTARLPSTERLTGPALRTYLDRVKKVVFQLH
ncbi:murein DD-endopeptidase MepM [Candidatus Erwinia haradaeae]|uniref:Murein DD-endopeptidase MepM n=1 Tax=Candidatus Erwinia haradaeae TaxID=1922217 RepID=A0A451D2F4_9GAMM|nr:murein DD-endopeptidase MepM [Candidatus Erwinia haradaeae]VFP79833.1 Murein DD-endopeptidase MepM [Candidatus Erwinia haradaeae]